MERNTIVCGDALTALRSLPTGHVQTVVTSPPYYSLRDYGVSGQIGLEETPQEYVEKLVEVFREVKRVLRDDGTCWLNLGDSYSSGGRTSQCEPGEKVGQRGMHNNPVRPPVINGMNPKNLLGIPWRVAFALQDDGWILRADCIWHKTNAMPESVTDRPTKAHEYVFLLSKQERYFYDADSIREPHLYDLHAPGNKPREGMIKHLTGQSNNDPSLDPDRIWGNPAGRNKRSVWSISTVPFPGSHFAVMPPKLVEICILAGSRPGDIVLDPFMGAGTVALVARQQNRDYLGIELNPEYIELIEKRLDVVQPVLWTG